ncbi:hypothetical protein SAMN05443094_11173 [Domibacillus enclensis]|uniref:Uncharacterized protein n=1 Tax=Domibacillus enclensis TaxID=1017273 RepID=A0A1N7C513_9BACI|nr:hypothetical protein SAMN05443094_11173 [Domibacillus enclensis]
MNPQQIVGQIAAAASKKAIEIIIQKILDKK